MAEAHDVGPTATTATASRSRAPRSCRQLTPEFARDAAELLEQRAGLHFFQLRTMGGAIADVPSGATAFAHRVAAFQVTAMGGTTRP